MLSVQQLHKTYPAGDTRQVVFDRLDLHVPSGQVVALLGASGSGKTTLLNLLSGIDNPDDGRVTIAGTDVHALVEPARTLFRRHRIGFVFQFFNLIPTLTVAENLALPLELTNAPPVVIRRRTRELLDGIGLPHTAERFPDTLSGGEQQRVAVARALAHSPDLLLADEPTGNLDEATGERVTSLLVALAREHGTTMLIVTHSATVAQAADRVLRLHQGRLTADG
jgi:putative ABC transport system ATP-binding protein